MTQHPRYYKQNMAQQLRGFYYVARCGSFTKAAEQMFLEQPALSLQVKALEQELDVKLFDRLGRSIQLTSAGQVLLELASPLVEGLESLKGNFDVRRGCIDNTPLKVGAGQSTILYVLPELVASFRTRFPHVHLELLKRNRSEMLSLLYEGSLDLGIIVIPSQPREAKGIDFTECFACDMVLITCPGHPLSKLPRIALEDIAGFPLVLPSRESVAWQIIDTTFKKNGLDYVAAMDVGTAEGVKRYVELGLGVSILPYICVAKEEATRLSIISASELFGKRCYAIATRKGKYLSPPAREFMDMIAKGALWPGLFAESKESLSLRA